MQIRFDPQRPLGRPKGRPPKNPTEVVPHALPIVHELFREMFRQGVSITTLAVRVGVDRGLVYRVAKGHNPSFFLFAAMANALNADLTLKRRDES